MSRFVMFFAKFLPFLAGHISEKENSKWLDILIFFNGF